MTISSGSPLTRKSGFCAIPSTNSGLFTVRAGAPAEDAIVAARSALESLIDMAERGVDEGIEPKRAYAMAMLLKMVDAFVGSLEGQL